MRDNGTYFNNCLTTRPADEVVEAMLPYLREEFYYPENFNQTGSAIAKKLAEWREVTAKTINASSDEIHFTAGGTLANNIGIKGFLLANSDKGNHIICSVIDYPDLLANAGFFEQSGFEVTYLEADRDGFINLEQLRKSIKRETVLFMTTLVNHTVGTIQPIKKIKEILSQAEQHIYTHIDACEAYGKIPIDVEEMGIDMMSVSGHKINGPQGSGFLYLNQKVTLSPLIHGVKRLDDLQTGGISVAATAGLIKAIELIFSDSDSYRQRLRELSSYLLKRVRESIGDTLLNGAEGEERAPHNVNISFDYIEGEAIMMMLDQFDLSVATGSACASQGLKPNYVLMALGRTHEQSHGSIKFTVNHKQSKADIDKLVDKLAEVVKRLRKLSPLNPDNISTT